VANRKPHKKHKKHEYKRKNAHGKNDVGRKIIYTRKYVLDELQLVLTRLLADKPEATLNGPKRSIYFISALFEDRPYSSDMFNRWPKMFKGDEEIENLIAKVKDILAGRAWNDGIRGILSTGMCKFHLINNCGAREIERVDVSGRLDHFGFMREVIQKAKGDPEAGD